MDCERSQVPNPPATAERAETVWPLAVVRGRWRVGISSIAAIFRSPQEPASRMRATIFRFELSENLNNSLPEPALQYVLRVRPRRMRPERIMMCMQTVGLLMIL